MQNQSEVFKHNKSRKHVIWGGATILICITALSCVSSFIIYRSGFADFPYYVQQGLALAAVIVVEGAFVWLLYGFTRAFSSLAERAVCLVGMAFLVLVMTTNLITHFMMAKGIPLNAFQHGWLSWGAVVVFIAVLIVVLLITLADPVIRVIRLELRYHGRQQETILEAKHEGLNSEHITNAMARRAEQEARDLAEKITGAGRGPSLPGQSRGQIGFAGMDRLQASNHVGRALTDAEYAQYRATGHLPN